MWPMDSNEVGTSTPSGSSFCRVGRGVGWDQGEGRQQGDGMETGAVSVVMHTLAGQCSAKVLAALASAQAPSDEEGAVLSMLTRCCMLGSTAEKCS
jgi:hypothetical protein